MAYGNTRESVGAWTCQKLDAKVNGHTVVRACANDEIFEYKIVRMSNGIGIHPIEPEYYDDEGDEDEYQNLLQAGAEAVFSYCMKNNVS